MKHKAEIRKQKEIYRKKTQAELDEMNKKIEELKTEAAKASARSRKKLNKEIAELEPKRRLAQRKIEELKASSSVAWEDAKAGVRAAIDDLERAYKQAVQDLK
jgi:molecular chaperone GrpE (heat shock protein)